MHRLKKLKTKSHMCEINSFAIVYFFLDDRLFDNKAAFKFSIPQCITGQFSKAEIAVLSDQVMLVACRNFNIFG
jgi:hypothetical protein